MPRGRKTTIGHRDIDELTEEERRWSLLRARGYSQGQAYRTAYNVPSMSVDDASKRGSEVGNTARVYGYVKTLCREAKKSDIISHAEWLSSAVDDLNAARDDKNWTAVSSLHRVVAQGIGSLSDNINLNDERPSAETLVNTLAQDDPELAELLTRKLSGRQDFDA